MVSTMGHSLLGARVNTVINHAKDPNLQRLSLRYESSASSLFSPSELLAKHGLYTETAQIIDQGFTS